MNKTLVFSVIALYKNINDGSLVIITNRKRFENCRIDDLDLYVVYVRYKDNNLCRIEIDDIIGIQFQDKATLVGMK